MDEFLYVFMREEVNPYVKNLFCHKISNRTSIIIDNINLNRYDVTINFEDDTVLIEEITFIEFAESRTMSISEFSIILNC